jgi:hypothetical protein
MDAAEILYSIETSLLEAMVKALSNGAVGTAAWKADKLRELGAINKKSADMVRAGIAKAVPLIREEIETKGERALIRTDNIIQSRLSAELPETADDVIKTVWRNWERETISSFGKIGASLLRYKDVMYSTAVDKAVAQVLAGAATGREAIRDISRAWADSGIPALVDAAGRTWSTEAYAQMLVRTNASNAATDTQLERIGQHNIDLVEVSSHVGAHPKCAPYQGRVFSLSGNSDKYPPLESTSKGQADGLFGINCGHEMYPFVEGMKKKFQPYPAEQNTEAYEKSQRQRQLERGIRDAKRRNALASAAGDTEMKSKSNKLLKKRQARLRQFIEDTGRTRRRDREQIY